MRICPRCRSTYAEESDFCGIDGERLVEQAEDPLIGERIDRYEFVERLGGGAMGVVYRARHTELDRFFAIKVLYGEIGANKQLLGRFRREAQAVSKISHPNIISVVDFGTTDNGLNFLVMESVDGRTLSDLLEVERRLPPERAAWILHQMAHGLGEAHRLGFVHRDVKPANVMLSGPAGRERVKLLDFGIVGLTDSQYNTKLTGTGRIVGTPRYMSPEQARGSGVGPPADLYSLGVVLYEMLAGDVPFPGDVMADVLVMHSTQPPPPLPPSKGLERLAMSLLEKRPEDRPPTAGVVVEEIVALFPDLAPTSDHHGPKSVDDDDDVPIAPPFDEDEIPTARPQPAEPLETPELASDGPSEIDNPAADLMLPEVATSQESASNLYDSAPEMFQSSFEQPRPTSDFDPAPLRAPPQTAAPAAIFSTLGSASGQLQAPTVADSWWSRRGPLVGVISLILSLTALGIVFLILRTDDPSSRDAEIQEKVLQAEIRARMAESRARAALERAAKAEEAAKKLAETATTSEKPKSLAKKEEGALSISESDLVLQRALTERGLTLADLEQLGSTKELVAVWVEMRDKDSKEAAKVLSALLQKTKETSITYRLLWRKHGRITRDIKALEKDRPELAKALDLKRRRLRRKMNRRRLSHARREMLTKALTELELEVASARLEPREAQ